jgi:hypothetical protein
MGKPAPPPPPSHHVWLVSLRVPQQPWVRVLHVVGALQVRLRNMGGVQHTIGTIACFQAR